jgi:hypothetical protein
MHRLHLGLGIAIGFCAGAAIGYIEHNILIWLVIGIACGHAFDRYQARFS